MIYISSKNKKNYTSISKNLIFYRNLIFNSTKNNIFKPKILFQSFYNFYVSPTCRRSAVY